MQRPPADTTTRLSGNVAEGWVDFWKEPVYWDSENVSRPALVPVLRVWAAVGRAVTLAANASFLLVSLWVVVRFRRYRQLLANRLWLAPWGFIWFTSVLQTFADHGDNPRFLIPLQAIVFLVVAFSLDVVYRVETGPQGILRRRAGVTPAG
jgi:hypothetical protein